MKVLFVTWAGGGNSTPVLGLGTRLAERGHVVKVASPDDRGVRFKAVGLEHEVFGAEPGNVVRLIKREDPDVVVVDFMMPSWMNQAEATGLPWIALFHTLYDRLAAGLLLAFTTLDAINDERTALGLPAVAEAPALLDAAKRVLITAPGQLDAPTSLPANTTYVGAILEEAGPDASWLPPESAHPLVVMSPGTTEGLDDGPLIERMLEAVDGKPVHALVNTGTHIDASSFRAPANVTLSGYVRHAAVIPHAAAMVTHGGLGSICAALAHGVPVVCLPLGRDQPVNAERVVAAGVGLSLPPDAAPDQLWTALERVLTEPAFRDAARSFADEYDPTASLAIAEIEGLDRG